MMNRRNILQAVSIIIILFLMRFSVHLRSMDANDALPQIQSQEIRWTAGSGLYLNQHKYVALDSGTGTRTFLANELTGTATTEQANARTQARTFISSNALIPAERAIIAGSDLADRGEVAPVAVSGQLPSLYSTAASDWWLSGSVTSEGYLLGQYVTASGRLDDSISKVQVEKQVGTECKTLTLAQAGATLASATGWPSPGEATKTIVVQSQTCPRLSGRKNTAYTVRNYTSSDCTGSYTTSSGNDRYYQAPLLDVNAGTCVQNGGRLVVNKCYRTGNSNSQIYEKGEWDMYTDGGSFTFNRYERKETTPCKGPLSSVRKLGIRPKLTLSQNAAIIEAIPANASQDKTIGSTLKEYTQKNNEMVSGTDYKLRLFDASLNVQNISKPAIVQDQLFDVKGTTIQIEKGTTVVTLDAAATGTYHYISAMARDKDNNTTLYGKIGEHSGNANTTSITLDLRNIMDTSKPGTTKQVNLYSEQINGVHESDLVSGTPLTVTFEVLEPRKEQKLSFDKNNATEVTYGETITLKANVNGGDTTKGWAADTNLEFALTGDLAASPVVLENPQFDAASGIATVTLKARNVDAAQVTLRVNKAGSDTLPVRYEKADEVTATIKINKRAITITPKITILAVGDTYPPIWEFDVAMSDTNNPTKALVDGDVLPYTVKTAALKKGQPDKPNVDQNNKITVDNKTKKWGLSLSNGDPADQVQAAAVEAFEKKYDVTKNDYDEINNKKSRLEITSIRYDGMNFIKHPDDVTTLEDDNVTFTAVATYPTMTLDDKDVSLEEQGITYQWQYSEDGSVWKDIPADVGTHTEVYKDGEATFTYTKTAEITDTKKQYRCTAKNKRDVEDGVTAMSNPAGLFVTMEPLAFIQIPQSVELVEDRKREFAINKTADEANVIKLNEYKNTISGNKETTPKVPEGEFKVYVQTPFYLSLNKDEKQHDKKYQVRVTDANDKPLTTKLEADKYLLTSLSYKTDKKQDAFTLKTPVDRKKIVGIYTGNMVFTIRYVKPSTGF